MSSRASRRSTTGAARRPARRRRVLQPAALDRRARLVNEVVRGRGHADRASSSDLVADRHARSPSGATTSPTWSATRTRRRPRSRARTRALSQALGAAADHAAARQHDVREPARDARRPRPAGRRVEAGDEGPRAVPARAAPARARRATRRSPTCARWSAGRAPTTTSIDATRKLPALAAGRQPGVRATRRRRSEESQPVLEFMRPYIAELVGWFRDFGQGAANYDANGHYARIQPIFNAFQFADNPAGGTLVPIAAEPAPRRPADRDRHALPGRRQPAAPRTARRRGATPSGNLDCDPTQVLARPMKRVARRSLAPARGRASLRRAVAPARATSRPLQGARDLRQRRLRDPGRGRQDRRASRSARSTRSTSRRTTRRPSCCDIDRARLSGLPPRRRVHVRPQSLIGENFVECTPTQPRAAARAAAAAAAEDRPRGRARASTCCR